MEKDRFSFFTLLFEEVFFAEKKEEIRSVLYVSEIIQNFLHV
jgi:hypothetical protein